MSRSFGSLRTELDEKLQPPIDVMLDPSLLASGTSLDRLETSTVLEAQTQATLDFSPTTPRVGNLYVPASFRQLIDRREQFDVQKTDVWNFYRGQANRAYREDILELLDQNDIKPFEAEDASSIGVELKTALGEDHRNERLTTALIEELAFLRTGGVIVSRTPAALDALRDAGVPTIDVGKAELQSGVCTTLEDIGYRDPASVAAFGISNDSAVVDALAGDILSSHADLLLYRIGR